MFSSTLKTPTKPTTARKSFTGASWQTNDGPTTDRQSPTITPRRSPRLDLRMSAKPTIAIVGFSDVRKTALVKDSQTIVGDRLSVVGWLITRKSALVKASEPIVGFVGHF
jgi:hypothetical protein